LSKNSSHRPDFVIQEIPRQLEEDPVTGWHRQIVHFGPTGLMDELCVHSGVLSAHMTPHPPHRHDHEEIHFALSDDIEFVHLDEGLDVERASALKQGSVFFCDSTVPHTFRNSGKMPVSYLHVRWKQRIPFVDGKPGLRFSYPDTGLNGIFPATSGEGFESIEIYSGPTRYLSRLNARFLTLQSGCVIPLHRHDHEVLFALVSGCVDILGKKLDAPGFAFMGTRTPHSIINHGSTLAGLYVIELHDKR
jgi:quercetin dioxygenase-like cupin family protein